MRPLGDENDKGFALINALDDKQKGQAILSYRVADLVLGPGQDGKTIQPEGIRASALTAAQQTMLWDSSREWAGIMADAFAEPRMAEIKSHLNDTYFAWSGPTTNGSVGLLPHPGPDARDRVRAAEERRSHPHDLSRSDQRLRGEDCEAVASAGDRARVDDRSSSARPICPRIGATSCCRRRGSASPPIASSSSCR